VRRSAKLRSRPEGCQGLLSDLQGQHVVCLSARMRWHEMARARAGSLLVILLVKCDLCFRLQARELPNRTLMSQPGARPRGKSSELRHRGHGGRRPQGRHKIDALRIESDALNGEGNEESLDISSRGVEPRDEPYARQPGCDSGLHAAPTRPDRFRPVYTLIFKNDRSPLARRSGSAPVSPFLLL
jgi:hypothetical protein